MTHLPQRGTADHLTKLWWLLIIAQTQKFQAAAKSFWSICWKSQACALLQASPMHHMEKLTGSERSQTLLRLASNMEVSCYLKNTINTINTAALQKNGTKDSALSAFRPLAVFLYCLWHVKGLSSDTLTNTWIVTCVLSLLPYCKRCESTSSTRILALNRRFWSCREIWQPTARNHSFELLSQWGGQSSQISLPCVPSNTSSSILA